MLLSGTSLVCPDQGRCGKEKTVAQMYGPENSYCTDEAGEQRGVTPSELVEGRAGANGRLRSQSTCRTQRRESVIQEAPRPRRRASRRNASKVRRSSDRRQEPCALARLHGSVRGAPGNRRPYRDGAASDVDRQVVTVRGCAGLFAESDLTPTPEWRHLIGGTNSPLVGNIGLSARMRGRARPTARGVRTIQRAFDRSSTSTSTSMSTIYPHFSVAANRGYQPGSMR